MVSLYDCGFLCVQIASLFLKRPTDKMAYSAVIFVAGCDPTDGDWCLTLLQGINGSEVVGASPRNLRFCHSPV